jgi:Ca-activated chloride channel homolog
MISLLAAVVMATAPPAGTAAPVRDVATLVSEASAAMAQGNFEAAATAYAEAAALKPESAELTYNLGVAQFRKGEHQAAEESFRQAASMATGELRNRAMFNMGTSAYAQALKGTQKNQTPAPAEGGADPLQGATASIKEAIEHFARTLAEEPVDEDARVNGELAHRLRRMLEQLQQNQQPQGDQQQQQENPQGDRQQQQQQNQSEQGEPSQQQSEPQKSESESPSQEREGSPQSGEESESEPAEELPKEGKQEEQRPPQGQPQEQEPQEPQEQKGKPASAQAGQENDRPMTQDEVERILQAVRDKERRRREQAASQSSNQPRRPRAPEKDW